jgi:hypothetical protein
MVVMKTHCRSWTDAVALAALMPSVLLAALSWEDHPGFRTATLNVAAPGQTGFSEIRAQTGILFTNRLSLELASRNHNLLNGGGGAAGDFDGDGWCDLYFCNIEGRNALYRNVGHWRFEEVTDQAGVAAPAGMFSTGAVFADINGDGRLDLFVTGNNGPNALFLNEGNGHFTNATVAAGLVSKPLGSTWMATARSICSSRIMARRRWCARAVRSVFAW